MLRVGKFGGSSVGNAAAIQTICQRIASEWKDDGVLTVPVVSAMYGVTNELLSEGASLAVKRERVTITHLKAARELLDGRARLRFDSFLHAELTDALDYEAPYEVLASLGERLSSRLVSAHLEELGVPSVPVDDVIITDEKGTPNLKRCKLACENGVKGPATEGAIPVVAGYYARSERGRRTLLGRGGTDLTAAIVARSVDATDLTLWKVECEEEEKGGAMKNWAPGYVGLVHEADPSMTVPHVHYKHASELAAMGKKVLHPETVFPAVMGSIPISIRNTLNPDTDGTLIDRYGAGFVTVASSGSRIVLVGEQGILQAKQKLDALRQQGHPEAFFDATYHGSCAIRVVDGEDAADAVRVLHDIAFAL